MSDNPNLPSLEMTGGDIGVLILHEATSTTDFAFEWAHSLHSAGMSVRVPTLSSQLVSWQETSADTLQEWLVAAEQSLAALKNTCSVVFIAGISMASTITLRLCELLGEEIEGVILLEPSLPKNRFGLRKVWRTIDEELYLVEQPLILLYSNMSHNEYAENATAIANSVASPMIREILLPNSFNNQAQIFEEASTFINDIAEGFWDANFEINDDAELIDAEFESIVAGLSLDESLNTNFLDDLDKPELEEHFPQPDPVLEPIRDRSKRNALLAMFLGPVYAIGAAIIGFNPLGIEPWPGVLTFFGGLAYFFYTLRDGDADDDGAIL